MNEPPKADEQYVPTREDALLAGLVVGWQEGRLIGGIRSDYRHRAHSVGDDHVLAVLDREGFFEGNAPVLDVACGPSPHVGYHLREYLSDRDVHFLDADPTALKVHKQLYREFERTTGGGALREHWLLGDALDEPYLLTRKAALVHGTLPTGQVGGQHLAHASPELLRTTLESLLSAQPERLALYLDGGHDLDCHAHPARVRAALDHLGAKYRVFEGVASADFTPREGGYLVLLTP